MKRLKDPEWKPEQTAEKVLLWLEAVYNSPVITIVFNTFITLQGKYEQIFLMWDVISSI